MPFFFTRKYLRFPSKKSLSKRKLAHFKSKRTYTSSQKKSSRFNPFITHTKPAKTKVKTFLSVELGAAALENINVV